MVFGAVHTGLGSFRFNNLKTFHNPESLGLNQKPARNEVEGRPDLIIKKLKNWYL